MYHCPPNQTNKMSSSSEGIGMQDGLDNFENSQIPIGFLQLPREIRDHIYEAILDSAGQGQQPPKMRTIVAKNPVICEKGYPQGIIYHYHGKNSTPSISCAGLLGSNHQISDEMVEIIMRRNKTTKEGGVQYKLHLVACRKSLLPTWLSLPAPLKYLRRLHVDLQLSTQEEFEWVGSIGYLAELSLQLLLRFFRSGPKLSEDVEKLPQQQEQLRNGMPYLDLATINLVAVPAEEEDVEMYKSAQQGPHVAVADSFTFALVGRYLGVIAASDVFRGKIKTVRLHCCQSAQEFTVERRLAP